MERTPLGGEPVVKVMHLLKHSYRGAGNVCAAVDLACEQVKAGHRVVLCSGGGHFDTVMSDHGVDHQIIDQSMKGPNAVLQFYNFYRALQAFKPDIVHAHMMSSTIVGGLFRPFLGYKLITTVHNEFQPSAILMGVGDRVIGVSAAVSASMVKRGVPKRRMRTVLNGSAKSPRFPPVIADPPPLKQPAVMTVCGQHPRKGVDILIHAFRKVADRFPEAHLYIGGTGPFLEEYQALAEQICPGRNTFFGHLEDPRPYIRAASVFILASLAEPAPLVIAEAREAGCAIVASEVGGIPEMLDMGQAGLLVPPGDAGALAEAICSLLADPEYLASMRSRAQSDIARFDVARMAADTEAVYRDALGTKTIGPIDP